NHAEVSKVLTEGGADVGARSVTRKRALLLGNRYLAYDDFKDVKEVQEGGATPLLFAVQQGSVESAGVLLAAGANINDALPDGNSALVVAAHSGRSAVAQFLLDKGADPNAAGAGYTALHAATLLGDLPLANALLAHKARPDPRLEKGTPVRRY